MNRMKKQIVTIWIFLLLVSACNEGQKDRSIAGNLDTAVYTLTPSPKDYNEEYALWAYQFDTLSREFKPVKLKRFNGDSLTPQSIEAIVNKTWLKVQIQYLRTSHDTVFITIPYSEVLTQQMGSTGAEEFMVSTTYSFTELKGIKYVAYDFELGDHASPGIYQRASWDQ
jgi:hypothetical protein